MAETTTKTKKAEPVSNALNELVDVFLFRDAGKYSDDVFVGVNGKRWRIKRGVHVKVPRNVALVLERSQNQDADTANFVMANKIG